MAKKTILLCDDNSDIRLTIKTMLDDKYNFIEAKNGQQCLDLLKNSKPQLIILDIMMPIMDGWTTLTEIKSNKNLQKIPVIFLTAKNDPLSVNLGKTSANDYLTKPFDAKVLSSTIEKHIL